MTYEWQRMDELVGKERVQWWKANRLRILLACAAVLGALLVMWPATGEKTASAPEAVTGVSAGTIGELESRISSILSQIDGAGSVDVRLFLDSEGRRQYAVDRTEEVRETQEAGEGGAKTTMKETRTTEQLAGNQGQGLLIESSSPRVTGAVVVADGAGDAAVREEIVEAVSALLGLPSHRITVLPRQ